jgi:hypothetical protein
MSFAQEKPEPATPPTADATPATESKPSGTLTPANILDRAERAHPAFKLLWGVLALAVVVAVSVQLSSPAVALFGGLIVFLLLMVFYVCLGLSEAASASGPVTSAQSQVQTLRLFLAWSSAVLTVAAVGALFSSAFLDWPASLRERIFGREAHANLPPASEVKFDVEKRFYYGGRLDEIQKTLETKPITERKIRDLFVSRSIQVPVVYVEIYRAEKKIAMIRILPSVGDYPLLLCDVNKDDDDFEQVIHALDLPS